MQGNHESGGIVIARRVMPRPLFLQRCKTKANALQGGPMAFTHCTQQPCEGRGRASVLPLLLAVEPSAEAIAACAWSQGASRAILHCYKALAEVTREALCFGPSTTTTAPISTRL